MKKEHNYQKDCIFCQIANGEHDGSIVYETEKVVAFFDYNPSNKYHTLIIPKKHFENIFDLDESYAEEIMMVAKRLANSYKKIFKVENTNLINNSGKIAGQQVMHFHLHLIPRHENDNFIIKGEAHAEFRKEFENWKKELLTHLKDEK